MKGFTVIELMMVVVLLVVLISIAGPDLRNLIVAARIKNASFDVFSTLLQARSEAVTRNTTVTITPKTTWVNGWTVATASPVEILREHGAYDGITISGGPASISFNGMGRANADSSFTIDAPGASDKNKRCVIISASGRPLTKEKACP